MSPKTIYLVGNTRRPNCAIVHSSVKRNNLSSEVIKISMRQ